MGSNALFIPTANTISQNKEIIDLNILPNTQTLVGYIVGGIISPERNISTTDPSVSEACNKVVAVYINKNIVGVKDFATEIEAPFNFNIVGLHERGSKEKETTTARKVDKLRITFDLENRIAPSGSKEIFVCITAPDGTQVAVEALGSGKFVTRDGVEKLFTKVSVGILMLASLRLGIGFPLYIALLLILFLVG